MFLDFNFYTLHKKNNAYTTKSTDSWEPLSKTRIKQDQMPLKFTTVLLK